MRATDRTLLAGLALVGLLVAFWFMVLAPKREEAAQLQDQIEQLEASVAEEEQLAAAAEQARAAFDSNYQRLVVLGKAVPADEDTSSLFVQLGEIAEESKVEFDAIQLDSGSGVPAEVPPAQETTTDQAAGETAESPAEAPPPAPVVPIEAAVAGLPLGATVGPAGLPVMPYTVEVTGTFFELADFLDGVDALVRPRGQKPHIQGRLVTIDGFALKEDDAVGFPKLSGTLSVTTFVTPSEQGLTAGASPTGPAPAITTSEPAPTP